MESRIKDKSMSFDYYLEKLNIAIECLMKGSKNDYNTFSYVFEICQRCFAFESDYTKVKETKDKDFITIFNQFLLLIETEGEDTYYEKYYKMSEFDKDLFIDKLLDIVYYYNKHNYKNDQ